MDLINLAQQLLRRCQETVWHCWKTVCKWVGWCGHTRSHVCVCVYVCVCIHVHLCSYVLQWMHVYREPGGNLSVTPQMLTTLF